MKRQKSLLKKLAIGLGVLTAVLILFLLEENVRGRIALRRYLNHMRDQGEKLTLAELELPKRPTGGHGAAELLALTNQFDSLRKECPFPIDFVARLRLPAPGRAVVRSEQSDPGINRTGAYATSRRVSWADLDEQAARAADMLKRLKEVLAQPALGFPIDYTQGMEVRLPHLNVLRDGANWLALAALNDLHRHDLSAAATNIMAIGRHQLRTGKLPSDLAALAPAYLPQLPHDWMDGEPLRYQPHPDGTFTLYSVGADGRDDGGDPKPADRPRALSIWDGRDAV